MSDGRTYCLFSIISTVTVFIILAGLTRDFVLSGFTSGVSSARGVTPVISPIPLFSPHGPSPVLIQRGRWSGPPASRHIFTTLTVSSGLSVSASVRYCEDVAC